MPKIWIKKRQRDYYFRKAKEEKYRSRAAFKLLQTVERYGFINLGDVVVDLGAAPGGWTQVSRKIVGKEGFVLGIDIKRIKSLNQSKVYTAVRDITDPKVTESIRELLPGLANVVISDLSPNVSGIWEVDHARQIDLARKSLQIAKVILKPKGHFFAKVFQGDMLEDFVREVRQYFTFVKLVKPRASRARSAELYILGMNLKSNVD